MTFFDFSVGNDDIDRRIDRVIRKLLKVIPLSFVYKNIRSGFIRVNNKKVKNDYRMQSGDVIYIEQQLYNTFKQNTPNVIKDSSDKKSTIALKVVFENDHIKIINKAQGINVQAAHKQDISLDKIIKEQYICKQNEGLVEQSLSFSPGPLHRIDKNTTGLVCFSQSLVGARYFSESLKDHKINKEYLCLLSGKLENECVWEHAISRKPTSSTERFPTTNITNLTNLDQESKYAKSIVFPLEFGTFDGEDITLAAIEIKTGRTHQIRSQAAFSGTPLLGDSAYGYIGSVKHFFLHAYSLSFPNDNPIGLPNKIIADLPISFKDFILQHLPNFTNTSYN